MQATAGGDFFGAEETYRRAIELHPEVDVPYAELAQLLIWGGGAATGGRNEEIRALFQKALAIGPKNAKTLAQFAR